jgi:uncharacterized protein (DUF1810 family)
VSGDPFDLQRFVDAQDPVYAAVLEELEAGRKRGHWMWYVFPQVEGLGGSAMAQAYAIGSREEAAAYAAHPILGARLRECTGRVLAVNGRTAEQIFSYPDYLKFRSCMTLFEQCAAEPEVFRAALVKYFDGQPDALTLEILNRV